jgi:predicted permease
MLKSLTAGFRALFRREIVEQELNDELQHYLDLAIEEKMRGGLSREAAERAVRIAMGGVEATKERVRSGGWEAAVDALWRDIRYALRGLRRAPAFSAIAVATLALGIGANTAMFSVVNAVMLRPLPYRDAHRLALIWTNDARRRLPREATAYRNILDWRSESRVFQSMAYYSLERSSPTINDVSRARQRTRRALVSGNLFSVLGGVVPVKGRLLTPADEENREPVVVISYSAWQKWFNGAPDIVGKTVTDELGKRGPLTLTVVGVLPQDFYFPDKLTEMWMPATNYWRFARESAERHISAARRWTVVARLAPAASMDAARADMTRIGNRLGELYPTTEPDFPGFGTTVLPVLDYVAGSGLQSALWVLLGAVGLVLLVACANVANLLLARGATRRHEFAVRCALGASRGRLVRQLVAESMVLAVVGGLIGVLVATWGTRVLSVAAAAYVPRIDEISVDARVLLFAVGVSLVSGLAFGLAPAVRVSAMDASETLKEGSGRGTGSVRLHRTRGALIVAECALAIVLLAGAGLLIRSLARLHAVKPGFDAQSVLAVRLEFPPEAPPTAAEQTQTSPIAAARARGREQRMQDLLLQIRSVPGVAIVGFVDDLFIGGQGNESITIPGRTTDSVAAGELNAAVVSPGFFEAMRVPLRRGRLLNRDDTMQKIRALWTGVVTDQSLAEKERNAVPEPVVVNEAFVRRFFAGDNPIGKRFCVDPMNKTYWYEIVGVVGDMHRQGLERTVIPEYYGPYFPSPNGRADLVLRTTGDPLVVAPLVRKAVMAAVPGIVIAGVSTVDSQLGGFSAQRRFQTWLLTAFAALALSLAAVGIYGVVHYAVAERTREIGVRLALGATPRDVLGLVIGQGLRMPAVGIVIGLGASIGLTRIISHLLFEVGATDPWTFAAVGLVLAAVASAACYFPARRATRVDPVRALRQE